MFAQFNTLSRDHLLALRQPVLVVCLLILLAVLTGAAPPLAAQQVEPQLATWDVQLWPEYDQPAVLVIVSGSLAEDAVFPQQIRVPIPAGAAVHAVAYPAEAGNLLTLASSTETGVDGQTVVFELNQPRFVVEYYADLLTPPPGRSFDLNLVAPYAVQQASLALRQPSRASDLQMTPVMMAGGPDGLGNPTYTLDLGPLEAGEPVPVRVSYTKADADPSITGQAVDAPPEAVADGGQNWLLLGAGVALGLAAGAAVIYLALRQRAPAGSRQARRREARKQGRPSARAATGAPAAGAPNAYCVQCGHKFEGADKFCRNCGAPRR